MAIATQDDLIAALDAAQAPSTWLKFGVTKEAAGVLHCPLLQPGFPGAWSPGTPGTAGRATDGTATADRGGIPCDAPTAPAKKYVGAISAFAGAAGRIQLIDITWVNTGIVVTTTTAQTWTPAAAAARDANGGSDGVGVEVALLVTTATTNGAAISGATVSYTNSDGTPGRVGTLNTASAIPATAVAGTVVPFALQAGDVGVRSVEGITLGTSLGGGAVSLILFRRVTIGMALEANRALTMSLLDLGMPQVFDDSLLAVLELPSATTAANLDVHVVWAEG